MKILNSILRCAYILASMVALTPLIEAHQISTHPEVRPNFAWAKITKFSGSDQPYIALTRTFATQIAKGASPLSIYQKNLGRATQGDTKSLFLLGLSAQQNMKDGPTVWLERYRLILQTLDLFEKAPQLPQTFEFTRVRFLLASQGQLSYANELIPIGEQLLRNRTKDSDLETRLLRVKLHRSRGPEEWKSILSRAVVLQDSPATRDAARSIMSAVYDRLANTGVDPNARVKEIAIHEQFLAEDKRRPQTPRVKENIRNTTQLLNYARNHR